MKAPWYYSQDVTESNMGHESGMSIVVLDRKAGFNEQYEGRGSAWLGEFLLGSVKLHLPTTPITGSSAFGRELSVGRTGVEFHADHAQGTLPVVRQTVMPIPYRYRWCQVGMV